MFNSDPQVLLCKAAFKLISPQHVLLIGVFPPQVQELAFPFAELHKVPVGPFLQPVDVPLMAAPLSATPPILCTSSLCQWGCYVSHCHKPC